MITNSWLGGADMWLYYMAQQGYVVFTIDNRGSANRGLAFENITHKKLGVEEKADQLKGVEYLKGLKYVDINIEKFYYEYEQENNKLPNIDKNKVLNDIYLIDKYFQLGAIKICEFIK